MAAPSPFPPPPAHVRLAAWYVTGPLGHLVAGALDVGSLLARWLWMSARTRLTRRP